MKIWMCVAATFPFLLNGCSKTESAPTKGEPFVIVAPLSRDDEHIWYYVDGWLDNMRKGGDFQRSLYFWTDTLDHYKPPYLNAVRKWDRLSIEHFKDSTDAYGQPAEALANARVRVEYSRADGTPLIDNVMLRMRKVNGGWKINTVYAAN